MPPMDWVGRAWGRAGLWPRAAVIVWAAAVTAVCVRSALAPHSQTVLPIFTLAAENWADGRPLYGEVAADRDYYRYSPLVAAAFTPLAQLPLSAANVLWRLLNLAVYLAGVLWWLRSVGPGPSSRRALAAFFLLLLPLTVPSLNNGQSNLLMMGLILAAVAAVQARLWAVAGWLLGLAFWLKLYPVALALLLVVAYPRRLWGPFAAALLAGLLLPFCLQDPGYVWGQYAGWVEHLRTSDRQSLALDYRTRDLRFLCAVWLAPLPGAVYGAAQLLAAAGAAWLCDRLRRSAGAAAPAGTEVERLAAVTALACCWMTVFGPATESCTWVVVGPSLAAYLLAGAAAAPWGRGTLVLGTAYALLVLTHAAKWFPWGNDVANWGTQPLAGLLFSGWVVADTIGRLRRHTAAGAGTPHRGAGPGLQAA